MFSMTHVDYLSHLHFALIFIQQEAAQPSKQALPHGVKATSSIQNSELVTLPKNPKELLRNSSIYTSCSIWLHSNMSQNRDRSTSTCSDSKMTTLDLEPAVPRFTQYGTNLTDGNLNSRVIFATDEFFAVADNLLKREDPEFDPNAYCSQGKVMDGWESRRRRKPGHDWCVIRLAYRGLIAGFEVDTAFFTGNFAPRISIQAANIPNYLDDEHDEWMPGVSTCRLLVFIYDKYI